MPVEIGDEIITNIPEQVAKNSDDIVELGRRIGAAYPVDIEDLLTGHSGVEGLPIVGGATIDDNVEYSKLSPLAIKSEVADDGKTLVASGGAAAWVDKKTYYHAITLFRRNQPDNVNIIAYISIINSVAEAYTDLEDIIDEIISWGLASANIGCSGGLYDSSDSYVLSYWVVNSDRTTSISSMKASDGEVTGILGFDNYESGITITDYVNRII